VSALVLERFRVFLDRPLDPSAGRAMLALAAAILLGLAALFVLDAGESENRAATDTGAAAPAAFQPASAPPAVRPVAPKRRDGGRHVHRQDPQDQRGSVAAKRAAHALSFHRALQHVPYSDGELTIRLIGARRGRAVLRVSAPTTSAARRGWRQFLHRYWDPGDFYAPVFDGRRARGGGV
jgi:hypothetical protein